MSDVDDLLRPTPKRTKRQRATRILTVDLERLPGLARVWQPRIEYIKPDQWVRYPSTICFAAKWLGTDDTMFHSVWDGGHEAMTRAAWQLYDAADQVITYNGQSFDNKIFRQDWMGYGLTLPSKWLDVDLLKEVRRSLGYESNSLQSVLTRLGMQAKWGHYSIADAEAAVAGDLEAQQRMETYNRGDVEITEALYLRLLGWLPSAPAVGGFTAELTCPQCGSKKLKRNGWAPAVVLEYAAYRCLNCGGNVRSSHSRRIANTRNVR